MNYEERHITFSTNSDKAVHIGSHFRYLKLGDTMYCPATVLGGHQADIAEAFYVKIDQKRDYLQQKLALLLPS